MKIMFIIPRMNGGGAERVVANLANSFSKNNEIMICTLVSNESFYDLNNKNINFVSANYNISKKNKIARLNSYRKLFFKSLKFIKEKISEFKPECVVSFLVETDILTYLATKNKKNIINIYSERNDPTRRSLFIRMLLKHIYKTADLFVCQSKKIYNYYDFIDNGKKVVISNPIDFEKIPKICKKEEKLDIVSVGRLTNQKNYELLINSFIKSIDKIPNECKLIIYGEGELREKLQSIISTNKMNDRIMLPGAKKNVLDLIKTSALYINSSNYEGFPNSLLEAMALGLPVISTDFYTGVAKELISKDNGIVVPVNNSNELSNAIIKIMNDKDFRNKCRNNIIKVTKKFNIDNISKIWLDNIKKVVENNER